MPLYVGDVEKYLRGEYWTNRYILDAASLSAAMTALDSIVGAERAIHLQDITFTKHRVRDQDPSSDAYLVTIDNLLGLRSVSTQALPLFCCLRVDFSVAGGRPSRKFLRGVLAEQDQTNYGALDTGAAAYFDTNYTTPVRAVTAFVDVDGQAFTGGGAWPYVGMHQLRRGSKRRVLP